MSKQYANPPIIEAVCEFRFTPDTPWDLTVPGLVYEKIKDKFPQKEQRTVQEIEIKQTPQGIQQEVRTFDRVLFLENTRKMLVQLGPRVLAVNSLKPYPGWEKFEVAIREAFEALTTIVEVKGLQRIGLRYINQIEIPEPSVELEDYFNFYLFTGPRLPQEMSSFIAGCEFPYENNRDKSRVQLRNFSNGADGKVLLRLDIDYFLAQPKGIEIGEAMNWVETAHDRVEEIFEGCITDRLRGLFGGGKQNAGR